MILHRAQRATRLMAIVGCCSLAAAPPPPVAAQPATRPAAAKRVAIDADRAARVIASHNVPSTASERGQSPLPADAHRTVHFVAPRETDPNIDRFVKDHYALLNTASTSNGKLFLFFPGTYGQPGRGQFLLDEAARAGYHVLGLEYVNATAQAGQSSVGDLSGDDPDPDAAEKIRTERVTGEDASPKVDVNAANSILNRTEKALAFLGKQYPAEGWGAYLASGKIDWPKVALGGHSQGAGMACFLAKRYPVARVCLFSGGIDYHGPTRQLAPWVRKPGATAPERWFGLVHDREPTGKGILNGYEALGLGAFGAPVRLDAGQPPTAGGSHVLILTAPVAKDAEKRGLGDPYHGSVASDAVTPLDSDGRPVFAPAWRYLLGE